MPTPLPVIRGASTALYPFTQTFICQTARSDSQAGVPARAISGPPLVRFDFPYNPLLVADKNTLKSAFGSAKGQFTTNLSATLAGIEYDYLSFDVDEFQGAQSAKLTYGVRWSVTQTMPQNLSPGSPSGAYPTLANGCISQLPYTQRVRFQTICSKMAAGPKYTYAEFAGGLTNFPTAGLMAWTLDEPMLSDADANTKIAHFLANWGDVYPFQFTDEDGTPYSNVFYASPQLVVTRRRVDQVAITTNLVQMN